PGTMTARPRASRRLSRSPSKRRAARRSRPSTRGPSSMSSAATAMSAAGPRPSTSLRLMPRRSQRSTAHDYDLGIQMGSGVRPRPSARSARALGPGGGGHPLQDAPSAARRSGQAGYRALQPFGQVPILQDGYFTLFESGAIVLYIGERSETLLPKDPAARAHATQWLIAALNSIEPLPHECCADRSFLRERRMGKAAATG